MALPAIIAHRGASGHAPENTLAAIAKAANLGATCVEFDCMLTSDKKVVLHHDADMARTANAERRISETPLFAIKTLEVGSWFDKSFAGEMVPTLEETLDLLTTLNMAANIELKPAKGEGEETGRLTAQLVAKHWPRTLQAPVISSFDQDALKASAEILPEVEHALLFADVPADWEDQLSVIGAKSVHCCADKLTRRQYEAFVNAGYTVRCFTVNDVDRGRELLDWGVESIFTDYPDRFL